MADIIYQTNDMDRLVRIPDPQENILAQAIQRQPKKKKEPKKEYIPIHRNYKFIPEYLKKLELDPNLKIFFVSNYHEDYQYTQIELFLNKKERLGHYIYKGFHGCCGIGEFCFIDYYSRTINIPYNDDNNILLIEFLNKLSFTIYTWPLMVYSLSQHQQLEEKALLNNGWEVKEEFKNTNSGNMVKLFTITKVKAKEQLK